MRILAFDPGDKMGVCFGVAGGTPEFMSPRIGGSNVIMARRCMEAMLITRRMIKRYEPDLLVIESPYFDRRKPNAARALFQYLGCFLGVAESMGVRTDEYTVAEIRKHFISASNLRRASAKASVMEVCRTIGWSVRNDNEADAGALWEYACSREKLSNMMPGTGLFKG